MMDIKHGAAAVQPVELSFKIVIENSLVLDVQNHRPVVVQESSAPTLEFFEWPRQDE
jgi:hypothetical protein